LLRTEILKIPFQLLAIQAMTNKIRIMECRRQAGTGFFHSSKFFLDEPFERILIRLPQVIKIFAFRVFTDTQVFNYCVFTSHIIFGNSAAHRFANQKYQFCFRVIFINTAGSSLFINIVGSRLEKQAFTSVPHQFLKREMAN
jgi:hypothetical protein